MTVGGVVIALSGFLSKFLSTRFIEGYKSKSLKELEKLKKEYQRELRDLDDKFQLNLLKVENQLQISKSTYELLFDNKVNTYRSLSALRLKYLRYKHENAMHEEDPVDAIETFYQYFVQCKVLLEDNALYISPELSVRYDKWMVKASKCFKQASIDGLEVHGLAYTEHENDMNVHDAQFPARNALVNDTQDLMESIFEQINTDLDIIRSVSNRPLENRKCS
ncbi:hypothetical protein GCM10007906_25860 [Vibrio hyugaensis]|uniref:Uncharacterized protein n=1 Tax=Vibrio hyugaensis TaxID=1534743 RepID=A0ABQ5Y265_9VIBR|nr:hypothetical protein GCM10007906_25860 [Vibrio hyugaensis]